MLRDSSTPAAAPGNRRFGVAALVGALLVGAAAGVGGTVAVMHGHGGGQAPAAVAKTQKYHCPMHPGIVEDHPGECPICGMKLVPIENGGAAGAATAGAPSAPAGERKIAFYRSPMNPRETSPVPRKDEMGMDYVPVYEDEASGASTPVPGLATVSIDPQRQQLIGLRTAPVTRGPVGGSVRTPGRVAVDQTRVKKVNVKVGGFVEKVYVDFVGKAVQKGDPLFSLYSPDLVSAQNEYLLALKTRHALSSAGAGGSSGEDLVASSRRRLKLWDVTDAEIEALERTGAPKKTLTIYSPISGVVTQKSVVEGATLEPGATPYEITDRSVVWVLADLYETDLAHVHVGDGGKLRLDAYPGRAFDGRVVFIDPTLDPKTRTAKARLELANPTGELKPDLFGDVVLTGARREGLRIPADAVVPTGAESVVFVSLGDGKFQPRAVQLGATDGAEVEVVSGLTEGQAVVTRANFLIDSESRLRASLAAMGGNQP